MSHNQNKNQREILLAGDVLDKLKDLSDDIVAMSVTSPPYNKNENKKGWLVKNVKYAHSSDKMDEMDYQQWQVAVLDEVYRVTKPGGSFFYNHKVRWEKGVLIHPMQWIAKSKWIIRQEIIWDRMIAANLRGWRFWQVEERIYWLIKPMDDDVIGDELESRHAKLTSIWRIAPERSSEHPAPFPIALPARAIYSVLNNTKYQIVLDPFCGTGTTLIAAKALGHQFIGIDISPTYLEIAHKRLSDPSSEINSVKDEIAKHVVKKTFAERKQQGDFTGRYKPNNINGNDELSGDLSVEPITLPLFGVNE